MSEYKEKKSVSAFSVIEVIVIVILVLMIAGMLACNVIFRGNNKATSVFGYSFYKTRAVNMIPNIPENTLIIAKKSEIPNIIVGSAVLCNIGDYTVLTRVVGIQQEEGQNYYIVKFDTAPDNETFRVEESAIVAKAIWQLESFGAFLDFATSAPGIIIAIIIPLAIIVVIQVVRIKNLRDLEREASSIDDIDELIFERDKKAPSPVTFTEPKFSEDMTGKIPVVGSHKESQQEELKSRQLTVDEKGKAAYDFSEKAKTESAEEIGSPLFTYDRAARKVSEPARQTVPDDSKDRYINRPTRIEPRKRDSFDELYSSPRESEKKVVFTPHMSNVIPESIANVQEEAHTQPSSFDESVQSYFSKNKPVEEAPKKQPEEVAPVVPPVSTIPENAVAPRETIAPVKKKKSSKTLEELMSIIDAEETKLKK